MVTYRRRPAGGADGASYNSDFGNVDEEADLYDEDSEFQENVFGFISDIGGLVSDQAAALRDNIYINEYIMGTFKNSVPTLANGAEVVKDTNLHGDEKEKIETFYDCEVEYTAWPGIAGIEQHYDKGGIVAGEVWP